MSTTPEVRIMFSDIMYKTISADIQRQKEKLGFKPMTKEQCIERTRQYKDAWQPHGQEVLRAMCQYLGLEFYRDVIDVNLAPWIKPVNKPVLMSFIYEPDQFVDLLAHELIHVLQEDASVVQYHEAKLADMRGIWRRLYGEDHPYSMLMHIPVHACLKAIYLDILKQPERLNRDIKSCQLVPDYKAAWQYVEDHDYKKILADLKDAYAQL